MYRQLLPQILRKTTGSAAAIATVVLLLAGLYGCGNKGDLYLPKDTAKTYNLTDTLSSHLENDTHNNSEH
jgi:predicted small lipoprotein YifL